jgi:hypothetical protein
MVSKKEVLAQLTEAFPAAVKFRIEYSGSGDNFDSFYSFDAEDAEGKDIPTISENDFMRIAEDFIFDIFERSGNPNFNDDGSEGSVEFDMINKVVTLHNYWIVRDTQSTGEELF